ARQSSLITFCILIIHKLNQIISYILSGSSVKYCSRTIGTYYQRKASLFPVLLYDRVQPFPYFLVYFLAGLVIILVKSIIYPGNDRIYTCSFCSLGGRKFSRHNQAVFNVFYPVKLLV